MYAKEVVEQIGEGLEEDGSVPFFDADMLPDGLAELYMRRYKEAFRGFGSLLFFCLPIF